MFQTHNITVLTVWELKWLIKYQVPDTHVLNQTVEFCLKNFKIHATDRKLLPTVDADIKMVNSVPQRQTSDTLVNTDKVIWRNKFIFETPIFIQTLNKFFQLIEHETQYPTNNDRTLDVTCAVRVNALKIYVG